MIDLLFLAHNRLEFTRTCMGALMRNTDWGLVKRVFIYDDDSRDGTREYLQGLHFPVEEIYCVGEFGSPVTVMNHVIGRVGKDALLAKIDNDTMLPPSWLNECVKVMDWEPSLDLLGIEAMYPVDPTDYGIATVDAEGSICCTMRSAEPAHYIGGIGLMRTRIFETLPEPQGRFGFTAWQDKNPQVKKAWLNPSLPVCLLDRLPLEPWQSLSAEYVAKGWQRPWQQYTADQSALWEWWAK